MTQETEAPTTVVILGSGTCVPSLTRSACAVLVRTGGRRILFDAGPGVMRRLLEAGTSIFEIDCLCLSHFHPDHSGELVPFLFSNKYDCGSRRTLPLALVAGRGFSRFFEGLETAYGDWIRLRPDLLTKIELRNDGPDGARFDGFRLDSAPVAHNDESVAFRLTDAGGRSLVYSGDTDVCDGLVSLARGADLLICESALPDGMKARGHLTPSLAGRMAAEAEVKQLVLTHFYPECDRTDIARECRKTWKGPLVLAKDGMEITLTPKPQS